jgi:phosphate transport system substrate-binding protein
MVYKNYKDPAKAQAVKNFVKWVLTKGQKFNDDLNYTSIPSNVANDVINTVNSSVK